MNKIKFIFGGIAFFTGINTLIITTMIKSLLPIIGYTAFQIAAKGSYDARDYAVSLKGANIFSIVLMILGVTAMIVFSLKNKQRV